MTEVPPTLPISDPKLFELTAWLCVSSMGFSLYIPGQTDRRVFVHTSPGPSIPQLESVDHSENFFMPEYQLQCHIRDFLNSNNIEVYVSDGESRSLIRSTAYDSPSLLQDLCNRFSVLFGELGFMSKTWKTNQSCQISPTELGFLVYLHSKATELGQAKHDLRVFSEVSSIYLNGVSMADPQTVRELACIEVTEKHFSRNLAVYIWVLNQPENWYIRPGTRFGADLALYCGDPEEHHSIYLVYHDLTNNPCAMGKVVGKANLAADVFKKLLIIDSPTSPGRVVSSWFPMKARK